MPHGKQWIGLIAVGAFAVGALITVGIVFGDDGLGSLETDQGVLAGRLVYEHLLVGDTASANAGCRDAVDAVRNDLDHDRLVDPCNAVLRGDTDKARTMLEDIIPKADRIAAQTAIAR